MQRTYLNQTGTVQIALGAGTLATICILSDSAAVTFHDAATTGAAAAGNRLCVVQTGASPANAMDRIALPFMQFSNGLVMVAGGATVSVAVEPVLG
jgi:hypothetical protein